MSYSEMWLVCSYVSSNGVSWRLGTYRGYFPWLGTASATWFALLVAYWSLEWSHAKFCRLARWWSRSCAWSRLVWTFLCFAASEFSPTLASSVDRRSLNSFCYTSPESACCLCAPAPSVSRWAPDFFASKKFGKIRLSERIQGCLGSASGFHFWGEPLQTDYSPCLWLRWLRKLTFSRTTNLACPRSPATRASCWRGSSWSRLGSCWQRLLWKTARCRWGLRISCHFVVCGACLLSSAAVLLLTYRPRLWYCLTKTLPTAHRSLCLALPLAPLARPVFCRCSLVKILLGSVGLLF